MDSRWFQGHSKDKEARRKQLKSFQTAFEELEKLLDKEVKSTCRDYDSPGWQQKQIATNEYNACIADIKKLLNLKE